MLNGSKHRRLKTTTWLAAGICASLMFGCASHRKPIPEPPPPPPADLRVGMWLGYPPLAMKENGKPAGVEAEFADKLAGALKRRTRIVELNWDDLIPALREGRIDVIMSGMSVTADRERLVSFCDPYMHIGQMALIRKADEEKYRDPENIDHKQTRIGFQTNSTGEYFARANMKHAKLIGFTSIDKGIAALRKKKIDLFIHDAPTIWRVVGGFASKEKQLTGRYDLLTDEALAWAVRQEDKPLRNELNGVLNAWKSDGQLNQILDHWIRVRKEKIPLP